MTKLWFSQITDIAFMQLAPLSEEAARHKWRVAGMNLLPPEVGTRIVGFGYHSSAINVIESTGKVEVEWKDSPTTTEGEVIEIYEEKRDQFMLSFPCFSTNARFDGGMSGGPVFNDYGELCGIICSSLPPAQGESEHTSYVTSLWPSMGTEIHMKRDGFPEGSYYPVLELARDNQIFAKNWEKITTSKTINGIEWVKLRQNSPLYLKILRNYCC